MEKLYQNYIFKNHIIAGVLFALALFLLYVLKETLVVIFISYIMVAALLPIVGYLVKKGVPNTIAVIVVFFATLIIFAGLIAPLVPFFASQIQQLFKGFPFYLNKAAMAMGLELSIKEVTQIINPQQLGQNAFALAGGVFGTFLAIITSVAISFYLLLDYHKIKVHIADLFPKKDYQEIIRIIDQVNIKLGAWLQGQALLSISIGILTWIVLTLIGMPFALPLAVLAGLFEVVPSIGPVIAAIPSVIIALTISTNLSIIVVVSYMLIQLAENNLLVPRIMSRAVGLNPVVVILGVIIGSTLLGIAGALLSVPLISLVTLIIKHYRQRLGED